MYNSILNKSNSQPRQFEELDMSILGSAEMPAPNLPLEVFGDVWGEWITKSAKAKNCPPGYVATNLLVAIAGLIGNARRAEPWQGWDEPTILWGAIVGNPSSNKSPSMDAVIRFLEDKELRLIANHKKEVDAETIPQPRLIVRDSTIEKLALLLRYSPKGMLLCRDELSYLLKNFSRRGGSDREFYIEAYGGRSYTIDRVKDKEPLLVPSLSISILGSMQPDKMRDCLHNGADDGLAGRFLYCWAEKVPFERPKAIPDIELIKTAIDKLSTLNVEVMEDGTINSKRLPFTEKAITLIEEWIANLSDKEKVANGLLKSHLGKLSGMAVRLSTVFAHLEWLVDDESEEPEEIKEKHIYSAIMLLDEYFYHMARRCFGHVALPQEQQDAIEIAKWIVQHKMDTINLSDFKRTPGVPIRDTQRVERAAQELVDRGWLKYFGGRAGESTGRKRKDYKVNPLIWNRL